MYMGEQESQDAYTIKVARRRITRIRIRIVVCLDLGREDIL
jgi:hypothetical protein